jgi:hypothetical protein
MKDIVRIFRFAGSLWRYYLGIGVFTVLLAAMSQLQPLFTKAANDQITRTFKSPTGRHCLSRALRHPDFRDRRGLNLV